MPPEALAIGVDVGGTKIASALVDRAGRVIAARQAPTLPGEGAAAVLDRIAGEANALMAQAPGLLAGVGLGIPGRVLPAEGVVQEAVNLGWHAVGVAPELRGRLAQPVPVYLENDAKAAALGEYYFGAARDCPDFVLLTVGSGLGGGVVANGRLVHGATQTAAEWGHLSLDPDGHTCACGRRGCAETVVSGAGLLRVTRELLAGAQLSSRLVDTPELTTAAVVDAARSGDELAAAAFAEVARWLGIVMAACVAVLNPGRMVLGGGLGVAAADLLLVPAAREMRRRVLPISHSSLEVVVSQVTNSAVGAASLVWQAESG